MEMRAQLAESDLATIHAGVQRAGDAGRRARSFTGQVWQVSPVIDPQTRQGIARIALSYDAALRPGGFASGDASRAASAQVPQLPQSAVQSDEQGNFVYIVGAGDKVEKRARDAGADRSKRMSRSPAG